MRVNDVAVAESGTRARGLPGLTRNGGAWRGWAGPLMVTAFGAFLRFDRLSVPHAVVFDETYYVPDAYGILRDRKSVV